MAAGPIALVSVAYGLASAVQTLALAEYAAVRGEKAPGGGYSAHAACALGAAIVGATLASRTLSLETLLVTGIAVVVLSGVVYAGCCGCAFPAYLPLGALAVVLVSAFVHRAYVPGLAAASAAAPFLITAALVRDRKTSLRDSAVAAIGGSILGVTFGIGATLVGAAIGAVGFKVAGARGTKEAAPRAFSPYLASAIALGIVAFALFSA